MTMLKRLSRLFTVKTRFEAFLVIYAIAVGAAERARHYLETVPGWPGMMLAVLCSGVVFVAGAKLLDAVRRDREESAAVSAVVAPRAYARRRLLNRNRPRSAPPRRAAESRSILRTD